MPPANSRAESPVMTSEQHHDGRNLPHYLSALRELENPVSSSVLNIANTLTTSADDLDDADDVAAENTRFLRSPVDPQEEWRAENARDQNVRTRPNALDQRAIERNRRERLTSALSRLQDRTSQEQPAYSDRIPQQNSMYDWAPAPGLDPHEELEQIMQDLRAIQPNTHPDVLRALSRTQSRGERTSPWANFSDIGQSNQANQPQPSESQLRSMAMRLHHRHSRLTARTRELQRHLAEREIGHPPAEGRDRFNPRSPGITIRDPGRYEQNRRAWLAEQQRMANELQNGVESLRNTERDIRTSLNSMERMRRTFLQNPSADGLQQAIQYLADLRGSTSHAETLSIAFQRGFLTKDLIHDKQSDFLVDLATIPPPQESSFLQAGIVLSGSQHSTDIDSSSTIPHPDSNSANNLSLRPSQRGHIPIHARRASDILTTHSPRHDRWPVKVTLHTVDYANLRLTATMEAYNVSSRPSHASHLRPSNSHPSSSSPTLLPTLPSLPSLPSLNYDFWSPPQPSSLIPTITPNVTSTNNSSSSQQTSHARSVLTYLEGEIVDMRTHTLLTESFKADLATDAKYWRRLGVFRDFDERELVAKLSSREFWHRLGEEYVLMRWKERCFVEEIGGAEVEAESMDLDATIDEDSTNTIPSNSNTDHPSQPRRPTDRPSHTHRMRPTAAARFSRTSGAARADGYTRMNTEDQESCGLTIRGFYYAALKRSDGSVEGLYHDPHSTPLQHLKLSNVRGGGGGGAWGFR